MAKVSVKLDNRKNRLKKDGTYPLILHLSHGKDTRRINLKFSFEEDAWDEDKCQPVGGEQHDKHIGVKIRSQLSIAEQVIQSLELELDSLSIQELKTRIEAEIFSTGNTRTRVKKDFINRSLNKESFSDYAEEKISRMRQSDQHGNAEFISNSLKAIRRFAGDKNMNLDFTYFTLSRLKDFSAYCIGRGNKPNTISAYLRPIQTLFNEAIEEEIIPRELNPFPKFKIPKNPKTKNRALRIEDIEAIRNLELEEDSLIWNAKNYFLFMFNNMGINFMDVVKLKRSQFHKLEFDQEGKLLGGRVSYDRSKTRGAFSIRLTDESVRILRLYDFESKKPNDFIFKYGFENTEVGRRRYKQQLKRVNRKIKELAQLAGIDEDVTSYFARHSWATIAKRKGVPVALISEGLGHQQLKTTQIYLDSFDDDALDAANESITK